MTSYRTALTGRGLNVGLVQLVRRGLRAIWVRGKVPETATVWAANHHSWWDGFVAHAVLELHHRPAALVMDADNLDAFGFLRSMGVVSHRAPRAALQALRDDRVLVVYPEGDLQAPGPLRSCAPGASWFARHAPALLIPVAVRVTNRGHQYPEAVVDIGPAVAGTDLETTLAARLTALDALIEQADPRLAPPGFELAVDGRPSWDERISRWSGGWRR